MKHSYTHRRTPCNKFFRVIKYTKFSPIRKTTEGPGPHRLEVGEIVAQHAGVKLCVRQVYSLVSRLSLQHVRIHSGIVTHEEQLEAGKPGLKLARQ